eukprot:3952187-Pyramimonas_sp.AAC.1
MRILGCLAHSVAARAHHITRQTVWGAPPDRTTSVGPPSSGEGAIGLGPRLEKVSWETGHRSRGAKTNGRRGSLTVGPCGSGGCRHGWGHHHPGRR